VDDKLNQANANVDLAKGKVDAAKHVTEEAKHKAEADAAKLKQQVADAKHKTDEAKRKTDEAKHKVDSATSKVESAQEKVDDLKGLTKGLDKLGKGVDAIKSSDLKKGGDFLKKIKKSQRKHLNQLVFSFDFDTDQIHVNSEKLDVDGEPLIQFVILGDGTILPLKLGSDVSEEELEAR
jgi:DNA repair exonuclease SbcCD ATPase subunit